MKQSWIRTVMKLMRENSGLLAFLTLLFVVRGSFADHMRVPSGSMIPNIQIGDHILVNKTAYRINLPFTQYGVSISDPSRGDVVVFEDPRDSSINLVKRLIAGPGDLIEIENGFVAVNGVPLGQSQRLDGNQGVLYIEEQNDEAIYWVRRELQMISAGSISMEIPEGHFFFMGDNRDNSSDSRSWGLVSRELLIGEAVGVAFSVVFDETFIPRFQWDRFGAKLSGDQGI